ncbi:MAG: sigma-70 family RNA polymerase sigma factor [Phycisphaerae bacterium]
MADAKRKTITIAGTKVTFIDHASLKKKSGCKELILEAVERVANPPAAGKRLPDQGTLFQALHACAKAYDLGGIPRLKQGVGRKEHLETLYFRIRDLLVEGNKGLVHEMIRRSSITGIDYDDLISDGLLSLFRSVTSYDPWRGIQFSTYACTSIARALHSLAAKRGRYLEVLNDLTDQDEIVKEEAPRSKSDTMFDALIERLKVIFKHNTAKLTPIEHWVISRRLLSTDKLSGTTLAAVGTTVNLSKERVRQIQCAAVHKLRDALANDDPTIATLLFGMHNRAA